MLKITLTSAFFLINCVGYCQSKIIGKSFKADVPIYVTANPIDGKMIDHVIHNLNDYYYRLDSKTKFVLIGIDSGHNYIIQPWRFVTKGSHARKIILNRVQFNSYDTTQIVISNWANGKSFLMSPNDFDQKASQYYSTNTNFTWGAMTLPVKLRFGNGSERRFTYEERLNLGLNAGGRTQFQSSKEQSINYLFGLAVSSVRIDSISVKDKSYYTPKNPTTAAITLSLGLVYQFQTFQIGLFAGKDYISGDLGRQWLYQGRTWLGIGLGISLFNKESSNSTDDNKTQAAATN